MIGKVNCQSQSNANRSPYLFSQIKCANGSIAQGSKKINTSSAPSFHFPIRSITTLRKKTDGNLFILRHGGGHHHHQQMSHLNEAETKAALRITWIGLASNVVMGAAKGVVGVVKIIT